MGLFTNFKQFFTIGGGAKAAPQPAGGYWGYRRQSMSLHGERDYSFDVGTGEGSSLIQAVVGYYARTMPEAPVTLKRINKDDFVEDHPFLDLLRIPNRRYSGVVLWMATMMSWICDGNAYWRKERSDADRPVELWYTPHWMMEPKWPDDGSEYISHYEYSPGKAGPIKLPPEDVVHFRFGLDPHNTRKGYSWVKTLLREIYTDEEASRFVSAMLRNMGIIGLVISPKEMDDALTENEANAMKLLVKQRTTGDQRGDPIVSETPIDVVEMGRTSEKIDTSKLRSIPESRVSALSGIPAAVLGFLAGMQQTAVGATLDSLRELAYESAIIPSQRIFAGDLLLQLLTDFVTDISKWEVSHDYTQVRVLQEDMDKKWARVTAAVLNHTIMLSEGRRELGFETTPNEDVYVGKSSFKITRREDVGKDVEVEEEEEEAIEPPTPIRNVS